MQLVSLTAAPRSQTLGWHTTKCRQAQDGAATKAPTFLLLEEE
jgi:hypothetical protein